MIKKIFIVLLFILVTSCGYESIYAKKNLTKLTIEKIELSGNKKINKMIISQIPITLENNNKILILDTQKKIESSSKNKAGDTEVFNLSIITNLTLKNDDKIFKSRVFSSDFSYNNISNKFDLEQYQKSIEKNLAKKISDEIFLFLVSINDN
tara:strand:- start:820 stop:1275 length:456 start_codon:yes stop_codon:yes gene_type:complete